MTSEQLREVEDRAVLDVIEMQQRTGIHVFTDGEYRRGTFRSSFAESVDGTGFGGVGAGMAEFSIWTASDRYGTSRGR